MSEQTFNRNSESAKSGWGERKALSDITEMTDEDLRAKEIELYHRELEAPNGRQRQEWAKLVSQYSTEITLRERELAAQQVGLIGEIDDLNLNFQIPAYEGPRP